MKKKWIAIISVLLVLSLVVTACGGSSQGDAPVAGKKTDIVIGTGGTAGTYYVVAAAMAQTVNNHSESINVIVQPSKGSVENINLTNQGDLQMGMSNADGVYWATTGTGMYEEAGEQDLSLVMSLYMSAGQMSTLKSSRIDNYGDLKGKKVCLGPPGTTIVEMSKAILREYGIDPETDIEPYFLSFDEGLSKLTDGEIDATFFVAGIPTGAMINATSSGNVKLVEASDEILDAVVTKNPYFTRYTIPGGTYKGIDEDVESLKIMTEIFAHNDLPEEVVYEFVKLALEYTSEYEDSHVVVKEINAETAASGISNYHPGAERYYKEVNQG